MTADYSGIAKLLHWLIAAFVIALLGVGLAMTRTGDFTLKFQLYQLHKSMGVTVLGLMMLRLALAAGGGPPPHPAAYAGMGARRRADDACAAL